jgi:DNA-binding LytR/AlgR family response regulator
MRCVVIDDEPAGIRILKLYIERLPNLELVGTATDALIGIELVQKEKPDVVFLDIEMGEMNGLDVMKMVPDYTAIVFCSAYSENVFKNYELKAVDWLTKPIEFDRFELAVKRVRDVLRDK